MIMDYMKAVKADPAIKTLVLAMFEGMGPDKAVSPEALCDLLDLDHKVIAPVMMELVKEEKVSIFRGVELQNDKQHVMYCLYEEQEPVDPEILAVLPKGYGIEECDMEIAYWNFDSKYMALYTKSTGECAIMEMDGEGDFAAEITGFSNQVEMLTYLGTLLKG